MSLHRSFAKANLRRSVSMGKAVVTMRGSETAKALYQIKQGRPPPVVPVSNDSIVLAVAPLRGWQHVEFHCHPVSKRAGIAADDSAVGIPAALDSLRRKEDGYPLAGFHRQVADGAEAAQGQVAQRQA